MPPQPSPSRLPAISASMAHIDAGEDDDERAILCTRAEGHEIDEVREGGPRPWTADGAGAGARHHHHLHRDHRLFERESASTSSTRPATSISPSRVQRSFHVLDGAVCVLDSDRASSRRPRQCGRQGDQYKVPRILLQQDGRIGAISSTACDIVERFGAKPVAIELRSGADQFKGIVDLVRMVGVTRDDETLGASITTSKFDRHARQAKVIASG